MFRLWEVIINKNLKSNTKGNIMLKSLFAASFFAFFLFSNIISAQTNSFQINGGIIIPSSSSNGFTGSLQYNYALNDDIQLYLNSGFSSWDKHYVGFLEDYSEIQKQTYFETYSSDKHLLIPVYLGSRINLHTNKLFTAFGTFEIGYSYLSYNNYRIIKETDEDTGEILAYNTDQSSGEKITENLFGVGIGAGLTREIINNMNIVLSFKLNSHINSDYYNFLARKATYTAFNLGFNFNI